VSRSRTLRLAHRGDWRSGPENSLAAFRAALERPACDGLEFDVRLSSDGIPVVCHDETLERVQGRPDPVGSLSAERLASYGVPSLAEVLELAGRRPFLDVEVKVDAGPALVEVLAASRGPDLHNAVVSSFDPAALRSVGRRAPGWPRWLNTRALDEDVVARALELGCAGVAVEWHALDAAALSAARSAGLVVTAWTVRRHPTFDRLAGLGVTAICVEAAALDG
jgi:glycerophosphoryl diester phosphodiesterase